MLPIQTADGARCICCIGAENNEQYLEFAVNMLFKLCAFISACPCMVYPWRRFMRSFLLYPYCVTAYIAFTIAKFKHAVARSFSKLAAVKCFNVVERGTWPLW